MMPHNIRRLCGIVWLTFACACTTAGESESVWVGTVDTLESGLVAVTNPATGIWNGETSWRVVEELRIGTLEGNGPDLFGRITDLAVDPASRMYVFDGQAQELRVFDENGMHVRTVGRRGGGPGEFNQVIGMTWAPDGTLWVVDPRNNRISMFDTAGTYVGSHQTIGGMVIMPWPGGFDAAGHFYTYAPDRSVDFGMVRVRHDADMEPVDTVRPPRYPGERKFFEIRRDRGFMRAAVPFSAGLAWQLTRSGHIWAMLTGEYRLLQLSLDGDTLRSITREFEPIPVTVEDIDRAIEEDLEWFVRQGGKIDRSRFPRTKPATLAFFLDDEGYLWVLLLSRERDWEDRLLDVFDPVGRCLGQVLLPFTIRRFPAPVFQGGMLYAVTEDELQVPYVVRARIEKT